MKRETYLLSIALAAVMLLTYPLTLAVVGTPGEGTTDTLLAAANRHYAPGKVVIPLDPVLGSPAWATFPTLPIRLRSMPALVGAARCLPRTRLTSPSG